MWWVLLVCMAGVSAEVTAPWWGSAVYYRILVDSFKDGDGDGLGDLKGLLKQISYVRALGADAIILSPLVARSTDCSMPGVIEFTDIDQRYGDGNLFNSLLEKAKKIELKVVASLPLQTVSSGSEWFTSSAERVPGFDDRLLWVNGKPDEEPTLEPGIDAWLYHEGRQAYWASSNQEAILNLCSDNVAAALSAAQCSWLKRGVSGVLLNPDYLKESICGVKLLRKMAADAMSCARSNGLEAPVILVESSLSPVEASQYFGEGIGANSILSHALTYKTSTPEMMLGFYSSILTTPQDVAPTWLTSSATGSRTATRLGSDFVDAINLLSLTLPGSAVINQGDELGVADTILEWSTNSKCWPQQSAPWSSPFPWDDTVNAGFTNGDPWLPVAPNYRYANAKTEYAIDFSHVGVLRVAAALRKSPAFGPHVEVLLPIWGAKQYRTDTPHPVDHMLLDVKSALKRGPTVLTVGTDFHAVDIDRIEHLNGAVVILRWGGQGSLLLVSNLAKHPTEVQLSKIPGIPAEMTVAASSTGSRFSVASHLVVEKTMKLGAGETVLLAGGPRHCGGPGPVDKIANKLTEGWQKLNKYFSNM